MRFLTFLFLFIAFALPYRAAAQERYRLVFWNVENLFDTQDDSTRNDDDFTPKGQNHWNKARYKEKQNRIAQTIISLGGYDGNILQPPLVVGLAEVENDKVLRDLCRGTSLRKCRYEFVHFDSPDQRGIDNALLYQSNRFRPFLSKNICVSDSNRGFYTRDILLVEGTTDKGDTLILLVNHFPSKRNVENERRRRAIALQLRNIMDTLATNHPSAAIIAMGDFNATPDETEIKKTFTQCNSGAFVNLMYHSSGRGSYKYQGHWGFLDQIIISRNVADDAGCTLQLIDNEGKAYDADFLLTDDKQYRGQKPNRTYIGPRYNGGFSDHLPVYIDLKHRE